MLGLGPRTPDFTLAAGAGSLNVTLVAETGYPNYRVGVRTTTNDWDSVYTFAGGTTTFTIPVSSTGNHIVSVASVDDNGIESLFSKELQANVSTLGLGIPGASFPAVQLLQNKPNPADEATMISVLVSGNSPYKETMIVVTDANGKIVMKKPIALETGMNEIIYEHGYNMSGTYTYTLVADGVALDSKRMVFIN
jgi:hypothetical protein